MQEVFLDLISCGIQYIELQYEDITLFTFVFISDVLWRHKWKLRGNEILQRVPANEQRTVLLSL